MLYVLFTWLISPFLWLTRKRVSAIDNILVIQRAKIGDAICSSPVFRALRHQYPAARIVVLASAAASDLLRANTNINKVIVLGDQEIAGWKGKWLLARRLKKERFDLAICLNAGIAYPIACYWAAIPLRAAVAPNFAGLTYRLTYPFWTHLEHHNGKCLIGETYLRLLALLDIKSEGIRNEVFQSPIAEEKITNELQSLSTGRWIGIGVSSGNKLKELGFERLLQIINGIVECHTEYSIALIGSAADRPIAEALIAADSHTRLLDTCGKLQLVELPALLRRLELYIGVDSGVTHMASAVNVPVVCIAGPGNMDETRPLGQCVVIVQEYPPCAPCVHVFRTPYKCRTGTIECLQKISIERILDAINIALKGASRSGTIYSTHVL